MTGRWVEMRDEELGAALRDLGTALTPDRPAGEVARAARLRIEAGSPTLPQRRRWLVFPGARLGRGTALALVALLLLAAVVAALGFGLPGIRIVAPPTASPVAPATAAPARTPAAIDGVPLGTSIDLAGIDAAAGFQVQLPILPELGAPIGTYVAGGVSPIVNVTYGSSLAFPAPSGQTIGLVVTALEARIGDQRLLEKFAEPGTTIEAVTVDGHPGFWIAGAPHLLIYVRPNGSRIDDPVRLAGNVLAWNDGEVTYRIEGAANLATALRVAASMR
ncbi:MAG TPA: hypothetical protein VEX41_09240 [Candidatus Eisenbacteria bacterium]|nr:hypothetical protein [Candidatus Eisenbacteria bacterium]